MTSISAKVRHVTHQQQTRNHTCHWPNCKRQVPPSLYACRTHWYRLPRELRLRIWKAYVIGQEVDGTPSKEYIAVALEAQQWIRSNFPDECAPPAPAPAPAPVVEHHQKGAPPENWWD